MARTLARLKKRLGRCCRRLLCGNSSEFIVEESVNSYEEKKCFHTAQTSQARRSISIELIPDPTHPKTNIITLFSMLPELGSQHRIERDISMIRKVRRLQSLFANWPANLPSSRGYMQDILGWTRIEFGLVPTRESSPEHVIMANGAWRLVHALSPWCGMVEFERLLWEPATDVARDEHGLLGMTRRSPYALGMERKYLDIWEQVIVRRPVWRYPDGQLLVPQLVQWSVDRIGGLEGEGTRAKSTSCYEVVLQIESF